MESILLTDADLDHVLGLYVLREGTPLTVHASAPVREALTRQLRLDAVLAHYCGIEWHEPPQGCVPLLSSSGEESGLEYSAFPLPGNPPRYCCDGPGSRGDVVGYRFRDVMTGTQLIFMPHLSALSAGAVDQLRQCDAFLLDGTFWSEDEMRASGTGSLTACEMGHLPVGGHGGSLAQIAALPIARKVYTHINNTNPMLLEDSPQRREVESAGVIIGYDGMEIIV